MVTGGCRLRVSFDVTGTGAPTCLAGLTRVTVHPGETRRVTLAAEPRVVADHDSALPGGRIAARRYRVALAHDAGDRSTVASATLRGAAMKP